MIRRSRDDRGRAIAAHKTGTLRYLDWGGTKIKIAQCVYCRFWIPARLWTQDHVYPLRYKGARRAVANVVLACEACNNSKSTWLPCRKCESLRELRTADLISGNVVCLCTCNNIKQITVIPSLPAGYVVNWTKQLKRIQRFGWGQRFYHSNRKDWLISYETSKCAAEYIPDRTQSSIGDT